MPKYPDFADIERNADYIVKEIGRESVDVYTFISGEYEKAQISGNSVFQFIYRSFYRLDNAGLTREFKDHYFQLMDSCRDQESVDIEALTRALHPYLTRKGHKSLQFSFVTKLANTVNRSYPIYDAEVARVFGFRRPYSYLGFDFRLQRYIEFYRQLREIYVAILADNELADARLLFREHYQAPADRVPDMKVLDFIFWSLGKLSDEEE